MSADDVFGAPDNPFTGLIRGSFGAVKTNSSYELDFVLSSIPISRIGELETASDALDVQLARFSDLLQRDIDYERVANIVNGYLARGENRVVFFPPLLVSLVALEDPSGTGHATQISDHFHSVEDTIAGDWLIRTWDKNRFQIQLRAADKDSGVPIFHDGEARSVHSFGCHLKWNPRVVKLVIIDGQHRLCALKTLYKDPQRRHVIDSMQIPICVVYPPNAVKGNAGGESIRAVLRDLFVTINQTAKEVSGHFLVLLDDKSLSALSVRDLAEKWKEQKLDTGLTKLHLLEWNQRLKSRSNQIEKEYSITTVSIVADVLDRSIFDPKTGGLTSTFLNLSECKLALEADDTWPRIDSISNREFHPAQKALLEGQVRTYLTPALDILFAEPSPYKRKIAALLSAKKWLDKQVVEMKDGAAIYRDQCLQHFRKWTKLDHQTAEAIESSFEGLCEHVDSDDPFFLNVFQQGMLRAWIEIAREAIRYGVSPAECATIFVKALEKICFSQKKNFFSSDHIYTRLSIYRDGGSVIVSEASREQWKRLILCTFLNNEVWQLVEASLKERLSSEDQADFRATVHKLVEHCFSEFLRDLENVIQSDFENNWKDRDVTAQQQEKIRQIIAAKGDDSDELSEYVALQLAKPRVKKARNKLRAILELEPGQ